MQRDITIKGRSLGGCSDLTLLAPIKPGFVESLESVTYKTRIKRVLETLHGARMAAHEHHTARLLSDAVERVGAIHSVRVAVLEPEDKVLLAVTFDGSWESYIRVLWDKVGPLLDLIFCGTVDYVTAHGHSFDEWLDWARRVQVETGFFYGPPESTARDALYLRRVERMRASAPHIGLNAAEPHDLDTALAELRAVLPSAEHAVQRLVDPPKLLAPDDPQIKAVPASRMVRERVRNGFQGLAALYRLTELHRPGTPDGDVLRRAALDLLHEFARMYDRQLIDQELADEHGRFERQLDWLFPPGQRPVLARRPAPVLPDGEYAVDAAIRADMQGGIVRSYGDVTHGLVLMLAFDDAAALCAFLARIEPTPDGNSWITRDSDRHQAQTGDVLRNLAFTPAGLRMAGIGEDELELFPEEFRQGMAARAGLLGDVRNNHPRRWRLPGRFDGVSKQPGTGTIELDGVHAVLQLRCRDETPAAAKALELHDAGHPLQDEVKKLLSDNAHASKSNLQTSGLQDEVADLLNDNPRLRILAVQPLRRYYEDLSQKFGPDREKVIVEHFGYADGDGQPQVEWKKEDGANFRRNRVHLGEIVLGHSNAADRPVDLADPLVSETAKTRQRWLANGSFLVMRKYRQFVGRLEQAVTATAKTMSDTLKEGKAPKDYAEIVYAKLLGRTRDGEPLVPVDEGQLNVFTYDLDRTGMQCPLHAHIRRAHPRTRQSDAVRVPRLMRRSMSYGPRRADDASGNGEADRGLVFMAYNASIGEQFEVVQRWLTGGNSTGSSSGQSCPILGVPENGLPRYFRFEHADAGGTPHVFSVQLEDGNSLFDEPRVLTRLEWGLYLYTPSLTALRRLRAKAASAAAIAAATAVPWQVRHGRRLIADLQAIEARRGAEAGLEVWKAALEDPESIDRLDSAAIWAAIRDDHGGLLRTPCGVLVASRELLSEVFLDPHGHYSVCGQLKRMKLSFGEIALGMDDGPRYRKLSEKINTAIGKLEKEEVFDLALRAATKKIQDIVGTAVQQSKDVGDVRFEAGFDMREVLDEVLATLSEEWFGLGDDPLHCFRKGGTDWAWQPGQPPLYPGHFTALSRYMFQPNPGDMAVELGEAYGQALRGAMRLFVADHRARGSTPKRSDKVTDAPLAKAVFDDPAHDSDDLVARTMVGVLMGFNPTIIGAVLNVLREWQRDGSFGALRARLDGKRDLASAEKALDNAMAAAARMRPMPQLGWRTALSPHRLGSADGHALDIAAGEKLVLGIVSGTQQSLADGQPDGHLMFGGVRVPGECPGSRPTHACPGHEAGLGAMLGALTALLARPESLRHGVAQMTFLLEGKSGFVLPAPSSPPPANAAAPGARTLPRPSAADKPFIFAWGDSWLDFPDPRVTDLRDCLAASNYFVPETYCKYTVWPKAQTMAADTADFCADLDSFMLSPRRPAAILLSAGGNDSTGDTLFGLLHDKNNDPNQDALNPEARKAHIAGLRRSYTMILDAIKQVLDDYPDHPVPIFIHGYDYPTPHGKNLDGDTYPAKWLRKPFEQRKYDLTNGDMPKAQKAMKDLIDDLNEMLKILKKSYPSLLYHVDFRGMIKAGQAANDAVKWFDDLHPTGKAFELLAKKLKTEIDLGIKEASVQAGAPA